MRRPSQDSIDDAIDAWHALPDCGMSLATWLGWSDEEYAAWACSPSRWCPIYLAPPGTPTPWHRRERRSVDGQLLIYDRCTAYGLILDYARSGGGNPPGVGGQQTSMSRTWWRVDEGPWWCLSPRLKRSDLIAMAELLLEAGVVRTREP